MWDRWKRYRSIEEAKGSRRSLEEMGWRSGKWKEVLSLREIKHKFSLEVKRIYFLLLHKKASALVDG